MGVHHLFTEKIDRSQHIFYVDLLLKICVLKQKKKETYRCLLVGQLIVLYLNVFKITCQRGSITNDLSILLTRNKKGLKINSNVTNKNIYQLSANCLAELHSSLRVKVMINQSGNAPFLCNATTVGKK